MAGAVTPEIIKVFYDLNNLIVLAARVPQIIQNFQVSTYFLPVQVRWKVSPYEA